MATQKTHVTRSGKHRYKKKDEFRWIKDHWKPLAIAAAVVLAAIILIAVLWGDGSLKVVDGVAQTEGEYPLVYNKGNIDHPKYYFLGNAAAAEGSHLDTDMALGADENVRFYTYKPDDENAGYALYYVLATEFTAEEGIKSYQSDGANMIAGYSTTEAVETQIAGRNVIYTTVSYLGVDDAGNPLPEEEQTHIFVAFVDVQGKTSINVQIQDDGEGEIMTEEEYLALLEDIIEVTTFADKE